MRRSLYKYKIHVTKQVPLKNYPEKIDSNLTFHDHIISLCSKANKKLSALSRISKYMGINKRGILMKSYIFSQFN